MSKLLLLLSILFSSGAFAVVFGSPSYVSVTSSSQQVLAQNNLRSYLLIVNVGANTIYVNYGNTGSSSGIPVYPGSNWELGPNSAPTNSVFLDCPTGSLAKVLQGQ